jgi:hypothetical protein
MIGLLAVLAAAAIQEPPPPTASWKADFRLTVEERDGHYLFVVEGSTNVPAEVVLRARVYAVEKLDAGGEDEEPLVWEDDESRPAWKTIERRDGKFREEVYRFSRKPWAIRYRARLHYRPRDQSDEAVRTYGADDWSAAADLRYGTQEEFVRQMRDRVQEVMRDLETIEGLFADLKREFERHRRTFEAPAWKAWKDPWYARVEEIAERNRERYNLWAVWMERQARMRVGGMCELLQRILVAAGEFLAEGKESEEFVRRKMEDFHGYFEEAIEVIGVPMPLDASRVGPILAAYEEAFRPLREWVKAGGAGPDPRPRARRACLEALLRLPPFLKNRKSAYRFVNDLGLRFRELLEAVGGDPSSEAARRALAAHDEALRDLQKLAGVR